MKKTLLLTAAVLLAAAAPAMAKKTGPVLKFTETVFDFGVVPEKGGPVSHEFEFTNAGDQNLVITDATADCGCTVPEYPAKPVPPGGKGKVKVTFNPDYRLGSFGKVVTLRSNAKARKARIKITGTVRK